ncbi:RodZ family helix-turn-helix domain-containing protein [Micromonospora sp. HM5-17]|jgi:predicted transcriptional regulator|uniref:helix-turn-helix domain-containing protein n=1 Tax=Micromonospora sp. HM5-17 TaxID=2487710 RepID=UPI000F46385F|nr:helix-turn-helix transcriptional regulator [Micromonospora sp. HM5-17]ROT26246.1 helix-turn-helix domain-containing protein [Micromonospora sp. HM5-17]
MAKPRARPGTTVPIDGAELRRARIDRGLEVADLARRLRISRAYLTKLELGHSPRASVTVYAGLVRLLQPADANAFRADRDASAADRADVRPPH